MLFKIVLASIFFLINILMAILLNEANHVCNFASKQSDVIESKNTCHKIPSITRAIIALSIKMKEHSQNMKVECSINFVICKENLNKSSTKGCMYSS
jgi:hypothetical protein